MAKFIKGQIPWNKGRALSEEHILKMSESRKGKPSKKKGIPTGISWNKGKRGLQIAWNKGRKLSEDHKRKLSESHTGKSLSDEHKDHLKGRTPWNKGTKGIMISWNKGKKTPIETIEKMRRTKKESANTPRRENHYKWNNGITRDNFAIRRSLDTRLWREAVFERDKWTCQECGVIGGVLHAHHIKPFAVFPELRFANDNGITFCKQCHLVIHRTHDEEKSWQLSLAM